MACQVESLVCDLHRGYNDGGAGLGPSLHHTHQRLTHWGPETSDARNSDQQHFSYILYSTLPDYMKSRLAHYRVNDIVLNNILLTLLLHIIK